MTAPPFARGVGGAYIMRVDIGIMPVSIAKARESMAGVPLSSAHVSHWLAQASSSLTARGRACAGSQWCHWTICTLGARDIGSARLSSTSSHGCIHVLDDDGPSPSRWSHHDEILKLLFLSSTRGFIKREKKEKRKKAQMAHARSKHPVINSN